jgi:hypothetical protein
VDLFAPCPWSRIEAIHRELDGRAFASWLVPRIDGPKAQDRGGQHTYTGIEVRVVIAYNGRTTVYPRTARWLQEFSEVFPELAGVAAESPLSYAHREYPKQQLASYVYRGGNLSIDATGGSDFPGGEISIQGPAEDILGAEAELTLQGLAERTTITAQLRAEVIQLRGQVTEQSQLLIEISKLFQKSSNQIPNAKPYEGEMFK